MGWGLVGTGPRFETQVDGRVSRMEGFRVEGPYRYIYIYIYIKLQVKKETPHVKIFIYEIFLTVFLVYVSEQMFLHQYEINSVQNKLKPILKLSFKTYNLLVMQDYYVQRTTGNNNR